MRERWKATLRDLGAVHLHLDRHRELVLARAQRAGAGSRAPRAASARPRRARRRSCRAGTPRARAARPGARRRSRRRCAPRAGCGRPRARAEMASSKSRASSGSIVKVGSVGQVDAGVGRVGLVGARRSASASAARGKLRRRPRSSISALEHVARDVGPAEPADHARAALARAHQHEVALAARRRARRRCAGPRPNSGSATRKRPRFSSTATSGWSRRRAGRPRTLRSRACRAACRARRAAPRRARCRGSSDGLAPAGLMPLVGDRLAARAGSSWPR